MRPPKQAHKNANSDSRQTNHCKMGITILPINKYRNLHFIKFSICLRRKRYTFPCKKENYTYFAIFD